MSVDLFTKMEGWLAVAKDGWTFPLEKSEVQAVAALRAENERLTKIERAARDFVKFVVNNLPHLEQHEVSGLFGHLEREELCAALAGTEGKGNGCDRQFLEQLTRRLADEGKLIEAGWIGLRLAAVPLDAPAVQLDEMRNAFMAGAQHLFASIMGVLDPEAEVTAQDMRRMELIAAELEAFGKELELRLAKTGRPQ